MILKIKPINYNLKSNLEKESILNSYKLFLKSFNFNIQIIIKSQKHAQKPRFRGIAAFLRAYGINNEIP